MTSTRSCLERTFTTWDGATLAYRVWLPPSLECTKASSGETGPPSLECTMASSGETGPGGMRRAILLFHRGHEHGGRWQTVVDALQMDDVAVFAWDARGHGRSAGERGAAESVSALVKDADAFARHIRDDYGICSEDTVVVAHSVGAVVAAAWVHDFAPPIAGLVLATPAFRVKLYVPFAVPLLRLRQALFGHGYVKSYVKARLLTHDAAEARRYAEDPLIFRQIAVNMLLDLHDTSRRLVADAAAIHTPVLMLTSGSDWVVALDAQQQFYDRLSSSVKEMQVYPGFFHAIFHERGREQPIEKMREFIARQFSLPAAAPSLLDADATGHTRSEHDRLAAPGGRHYLPLRWGMRTVGRLSEGMRLGWRTGFDSGLTLDYVYENEPRGLTPLGRAIDRAFLSSVGWRGIRQRRANLEQTLHEAVTRVQARNQPARLLDVAAGPGRYVLGAIRSLPQPVTAVLRDNCEENLAAGRRLSASMGVPGITFAPGDAFDGRSLASTTPRPNVAIVSGLYELFPDNARVTASLKGLAEAVEPGGYLIYTNQPWHPQLEMIARTLINRDGQAWVMRRRTQAEMDQLVRAAGFRKISMEIDRWGIFTVSLAERIAA